MNVVRIKLLFTGTVRTCVIRTVHTVGVLTRLRLLQVLTRLELHLLLYMFQTFSYVQI